MKLKNLFLFMALFTAMMLKADPGNGNTIPLRPIKTTPNNSGRPRTPVCVPTIYLDGHTLYFETSCDGCTLQLLDEDGNKKQISRGGIGMADGSVHEFYAMTQEQAEAQLETILKEMLDYAYAEGILKETLEVWVRLTLKRCFFRNM